METNDDGAVTVSGGLDGNDFGYGAWDAHVGFNGPHGGDVIMHGAISPAGDEGTFLFENVTGAPVLIDFEVSAPTPGLCPDPIDTMLVLRTRVDAPFEHIDGGGVAGCSRLRTFLLPPATRVFAMVLDDQDDEAFGSYTPTATWASSSTCGDGAVLPPESCDDQNARVGDTCNARVLEVGESGEGEPNKDGSIHSESGPAHLGNDFGSGLADGPFEEDVAIHAHLTPAGDEDVFAVDCATASTRRLAVRTHHLAPQAQCRAFDSVFHLRDCAGNSLAYDDDIDGADRSLCSLVSFDLAPDQLIYVHVFYYDDDAVVADYWVTVDFDAP